MPSLGTNTVSFLTAVKNRLSVGSDLGSGGRNAPKEGIHPAEAATVLELLQEALTSGTLTATATGTTTTLVDGAGTFTPGRQVGNYVVFASDTTTAALRGVVARIRSNTHSTITFESALPAATASGDTYVIRGGFVADEILTLRQNGTVRGGPVVGENTNHSLLVGALSKFVERLSNTKASATLLFTGQPLDTETVTIAGKVYTYQTSLTNVDGNVAIGASATTARDNLLNAINLGAGSGTAYAAAMTANPSVRAAASGANLVVTAEFVVGPQGNSIAVAETATNVAWSGGATLLSGGATGALVGQTLMSTTVASSPSSTSITVYLDLKGGTFFNGQLENMILVIGTERRRISQSFSNGLVVPESAFSSAPSGGTACSLELSMANPNIAGRNYAAMSPGQNLLLANLINQVQTVVAAYTLPT